MRNLVLGSILSGVMAVTSVAVWAGDFVAIAMDWPPVWRIIDVEEPIHAVYWLKRGWCLVTELSVFTLDHSGAIVAREMHSEVIVSSRWEQNVLVLDDFEGRTVTTKIDGETLAINELK